MPGFWGFWAAAQIEPPDKQLMDWTRGRQADPLDRTIDVQVSRLRKKIERDGELIKTVRSAGYIFTGTVKEA